MNVRAPAKKRSSPYAKIDWQKASLLFARSQVKTPHRGIMPKAKDILAFVARAGEAGVTFVFEAHKRGAEQLHPGLDVDWQYKQLLRQLERQHFVKTTWNTDGSCTLKLMKKGLVRALTYQLDTMTVTAPVSWDGRWRIIIFDIPVIHNRLRDIFRSRLSQLGLTKIQESVYVSPYACFDEIEFLRELYGISFTVKYILAERIEDDEELRRRYEI